MARVPRSKSSLVLAVPQGPSSMPQGRRSASLCSKLADVVKPSLAKTSQEPAQRILDCIQQCLHTSSDLAYIPLLPDKKLRLTETHAQQAGGAAAAAGSKPASLQDYESYPKDFVRRRLVVFIAIVVGHAPSLPGSAQLYMSCSATHGAHGPTPTLHLADMAV